MNRLTAEQRAFIKGYTHAAMASRGGEVLTGKDLEEWAIRFQPQRSPKKKPKATGWGAEIPTNLTAEQVADLYLLALGQRR